MLRTVRLAVSIVALAAVAGGCAEGQKAKEPAAAPIFITGTVLSDGEPVGADVSIQLRDERAEASAKVGDTIPTLTAAEATTDAAGAFTLRVDPADVPTNFFLGGHDRSLLNFELGVQTPSVWGVWANTMYVSDGVWRSDEGAVSADRPVEIAVDLDTERLSITDSFGESTSHDMAVFRPQS